MPKPNFKAEDLQDRFNQALRTPRRVRGRQKPSWPERPSRAGLRERSGCERFPQEIFKENSLLDKQHDRD